MTALQMELAETIALVHADARDAGHDPHPWHTDALEGRTACRRCGALLAVTVRAAGVTIQAPSERCQR